MTIVSLASYKEVKEKKKQEDKKYWKRIQYRYLGGSVRTAWQCHSCYDCIFPIDGGMQYRRDVYANNVRDQDGRKHLHIEKRHWPHCYGPSEDEVRRIQEEIERQREAERASERSAA